MLQVCKQHIKKRRVTERNRSQDRTPEKQAETSSRTRLSRDGHTRWSHLGARGGQEAEQPRHDLEERVSAAQTEGQTFHSRDV